MDWNNGVVLLSSVGTLLLVLFTVVFRLHSHGLADIPGPRLWAASRLPYFYFMLRGRLMHKITALHAEYGDAVRIAPNEVSYTNPQAWHDIYGYKPKLRGQFPLNKVWHTAAPGTADSIMTADTVNHSRLRRITSPAFSAISLKSQESIIQQYVQKLVESLEACVSTNSIVNIVDWLNWTMFDITGELAFHQSFGCLEVQGYHPWIDLLFTFFRATCFIACARYVPFVESILMAMIPAKLVERQREHSARTSRCIRERMKTLDESVVDFPDFVSTLSKGLENDTISFAEIESTITVLLLGGSETTASCLSGIINLLLRHPKVLQRLSSEVRSSFEQAADMSFGRLTNLPYLNAVINEGLRLTPPVPCGIPREVPPGGGIVCGRPLPAGTNVSVHQFATYRSASLWTRPNDFAPERWLKGNEAMAFASDCRSALQPFSVGPRKCMGEALGWMEMRLILAKLVFGFELSRTSEDVRSLPCWEQQDTYALWTRMPFNVDLKRRALDIAG